VVIYAQHAWEPLNMLIPFSARRAAPRCYTQSPGAVCTPRPPSVGPEVPLNYIFKDSHRITHVLALALWLLGWHGVIVRQEKLGYTQPVHSRESALNQALLHYHDCLSLPCSLMALSGWPIRPRLRVQPSWLERLQGWGFASPRRVALATPAYAESCSAEQWQFPVEHGLRTTTSGRDSTEPHFPQRDFWPVRCEPSCFIPVRSLYAGLFGLGTSASI